MIIALDYDGTYTDDPDLWIPFIDLIKMRGHSVSFVTFRDDNGNYENDDIRRDAKRNNIEIVYTAGKQKSECFKADVWIDDMPILIPSEDALLMAMLSSK